MICYAEIWHSYLFFLKNLYRISQKYLFKKRPPIRDAKLYNEERASILISKALSSDQPCMIARFGAVELGTVVNYISITQAKHSVWKYIKGEEPEWWWNPKLKSMMASNAGFFPSTEKNLCRFAERMLRDMQEVDVLGSWIASERYVSDRVRQADRVRLLLLEPYWTKDPWSRMLEGKRVLVVHPFAEDIQSQYSNNRERIFRDKRVLPQFASLRIVKAVQSIGGGQTTAFSDWFEALEWMEIQMDSAPYDVALIGCGAYGFPLAAHAKRTGHKAVHLGGVLQLLFGIKGKRWTRDYNCDYDYSALPNEYWISPSPSTRNEFTDKVEGGCYW